MTQVPHLPSNLNTITPVHEFHIASIPTDGPISDALRERVVCEMQRLRAFDTYERHISVDRERFKKIINLYFDSGTNGENAFYDQSVHESVTKTGKQVLENFSREFGVIDLETDNLRP